MEKNKFRVGMNVYRIEHGLCDNGGGGTDVGIIEKISKRKGKTFYHCVGKNGKFVCQENELFCDYNKELRKYINHVNGNIELNEQFLFIKNRMLEGVFVITPKGGLSNNNPDSVHTRFYELPNKTKQRLINHLYEQFNF